MFYNIWIKISALMAVFLIIISLGISFGKGSQVLGESVLGTHKYENSKINETFGENSDSIAGVITSARGTGLEENFADDTKKRTDENVLEDSSENTNALQQNTEVLESKYDYKLTIPRIAVDAPVLGLGREPDGKMDVPDNYSEVGWYALGVKPGEVGRAVLGAHVDNGGDISGVFKNLKKLEIGDKIHITDKAGNRFSFRVVARKIYDYRLQDTSEIFGSSKRRLVNLITCHGTFLSETGTYTERLVVTAELI